MGEELGRLVGNMAPGGTGVGADVDRGGRVVSSTDKDARRGAVNGLGGLVKGDKGQALDVAVVGVSLGARAEGAHGLEGGHPGEGRAAVGGLPQAVAAPGAKVDDVRVLGVDGEALARPAAGHVAADLEGERGDLPCLAPVGAAGNGAVVGVPETGQHAFSMLHSQVHGGQGTVPVVGVHAGRDVHLVCVGRIKGQRVDAPSVPVVVVGEAIGVGHGRPGVVVVEAVETANVGAGKSDTLLGGVELDRRDEPAAAPGVDVLPVARRPDGCRRCQDEPGTSHLEDVFCGLVWSLESLKNARNLEWTSQVEGNVVNRRGASMEANVVQSEGLDWTGDIEASCPNLGDLSNIYIRGILHSFSEGILLLVSGLSDGVRGGHLFVSHAFRGGETSRID